MERHTTLLGVCLALTLAGGAAAAGGWRYVVPKEGEPFANPPPRAIALSATKPADLKESVRYRGAKQRYARLVYGTGRTAPVTVVVDEAGPGDVDLYLDADRDGEITAKDRVAGDKLTWRAALKAVVHAGDDVKEFPRTVTFRYGRAGRTLSVATCGYVEGKVRLEGKEVGVRRCDGDANGLFADAQDRVWIDVNGDGVWEAGEEEFLFAPLLRLGDRRYALRADAFGQRLELARLEGTGKLKLALPPTIKPGQAREVVATFQSRDGVVATIRQAEAEVTVPAGDYRLSSLLLTLQDPAGGPTWGYVFTDNGGKEPRWHKVAKDAAVSVDPVGKLDFGVSAGEGGKCKPGESLTVRPALYTGDGLLIERAYRGAFSSGVFDQGCGAKVSLRARDGGVLASTTSGFA
jgi:hypothetical protein